MWTDIEIIFALLKAEHLTVYKCTFFIKGLRGDQGGNGFCGVSTQPCFHCSFSFSFLIHLGILLLLEIWCFILGIELFCFSV